MKCYKCGKEINDGARFCTFCGTEQPIEPQAEETVSDKRGKTGVIIALCIIAVVLVTTAIIMAVKFTGNSSTPDSKEGQSAETENVTEEMQEVQQEPLYTSMEIPTINLNVQNHEPGQKAEGMQWDSSLFYWLEDIDKESEDDGHIYDCVVEKTLRWYEDDNCFIEYNVYRNPDNREIYKIVSIVRYDNELTLTDYYYQASKPNFIFWRTDSIYTPTYASPEKTGQRFYFNNDAMVRWRTIETPNEIGEYVLAKRDVNYAQLNYYEQTPEIQAIYDDTERKLLNQAYNIYDSVANSDCIGILESSIHGTDGSALADMTVEVYSAQDGTLLYRTKTDETGKFSIGVKLDDTECYVTVAGNDIYEPNQVYGIRLNTVYPMSSYNNLVMHKKSGDEYQVSLNVYDATAVTMQEDGEGNRSTVLPQGIGNAAVTVRSGSAARTGEVLQSLTTDANGQIKMTLPSGNYTLQIDASGYQPLYYTVEVDEESVTRNCFAVPVSIERKKIIVMTWDNPDYDLDLTIFTPYQGTNGDMAYIGGSTLSDNYGNTIISDNNAYCEVAYVDDNDYSDYKIYVNNYTDSQSGNYASATLSDMNVQVYIYDASGLLDKYTVPLGREGVVWEVVELSGHNNIPCQRVYKELSGKNWWTNSKERKRLVKTKKEYYSYGPWVESEYDKYGNIVTERTYRDGGDEVTTTTYQNTYDERGRLVSVLCICDGLSQSRTDYAYDMENGDEIVRSWTRYNCDDGSVLNAGKDVLDKSGRLKIGYDKYDVHMHLYDENEDVMSYVRKYDDVNNYQNFYVYYHNLQGDIVKFEKYYTSDMGFLNASICDEADYKCFYDDNEYLRLQVRNMNNEWASDSAMFYTYYGDETIGDVNTNISDEMMYSVAWAFENASGAIFNESTISADDLYNDSECMSLFIGSMLASNVGAEDIWYGDGVDISRFNCTAEECERILENAFGKKYDMTKLPHIDLQNLDISEFESVEIPKCYYDNTGDLIEAAGAIGKMCEIKDVYVSYREEDNIVVKYIAAGDEEWGVRGYVDINLREIEGIYYIDSVTYEEW